MVTPQLTPDGQRRCGTAATSTARTFRASLTPGGCLSVLGLGDLVYRSMGDAFRFFLLVTIVLLFVQFLVLARRLE